MLKRIAALTFLTVMTFSGHAQATKSDLQYWMAESASWKIAKNWKLSVLQEVYFRDDASEYYYEHTELGAVYSGAASWVDLGLNFRHILTKSTKGVWTREEQPSLQATLKYTVKGFAISDRNRLEYKIREDKLDFWNYRNQLTIKFPWKFTPCEIQPYIADEIFVNSTISENRSYAGFGFKVTKELSAEIYYMQKRNRQAGGDWIGVNVVGTRLKLDF